jgi:DNA polymerase III alpha subunit (gram-positive type)
MISREVAFDIESDGLLDKITRIWCLSYRFVDQPEVVYTLTDYYDIKEFFQIAKKEDYTLICHNMIGYDLPALKKVLNIEYKGKHVDTLPLSWYLNHTRKKHGLEGYGEEFGVPKPVIDNWETQTLDDYVHRCQEDTLIQVKTWLQLKQKLQRLYNED